MQYCLWAIHLYISFFLWLRGTCILLSSSFISLLKSIYITIPCLFLNLHIIFFSLVKDMEAGDEWPVIIFKSQLVVESELDSPRSTVSFFTYQTNQTQPFVILWVLAGRKIFLKSRKLSKRIDFIFLTKPYSLELVAHQNLLSVEI